MNLLILALPLGGIAILRLYENELIQSTEAQLIAQGAHVRESFRTQLLRRRAEAARAETDGPAASGARERNPEDSTSTDARDRTAAGQDRTDATAPRAQSFASPGHVRAPDAPEPPDAILPRLDISSDRVLPPEPDSLPASADPDPIAAAAGAEIAPGLQAAGRATLTGIRIVDARGIVVATTRTELGHSLLAREEIARALAGAPVSLIRERTSERPSPPLASISRGQRYRVIVALPVIEEDRVVGAVLLARTPMDIQKALYLNRRPILLGVAALIAVVTLVSVMTAFLIDRPVRRLIDQADRIARGEKGASIDAPEPATYELARLSGALRTMARTLERRADYIKTFASHVSHEFKTPLTTIQGTVELLHDHGDAMTREERARFLANVRDAGTRLERLLRRLHELARADVLQAGNERTPVAPVLERVAAGYREAGLRIRLDHDPSAPEARISAEILGEIVGNLLENARLHGGEGVGVEIRTRAIEPAPIGGERSHHDSARTAPPLHAVSRRTDPSDRARKATVARRRDREAGAPRIEIRVSDDGPGISEGNAERIFTPFFTTARERGGTGLGLSIVRALLEAHGGSIELERHASGTEFVILLSSA